MDSASWLHPDPLPLEFFNRPAEVVAPELLGKVVWRVSDEGIAALRIVETEAYGGSADPGSHGHRGRTKRNAVMFGDPGHAYIYFTYGMHHCLNFVTDEPGICSAVLLRAGEPVAGGALMASRRSRDHDIDIASGPAKLTQALALTTEQNGSDLRGGIIGVGDDRESAHRSVLVGPRVGLSAGLDLEWRFADARSRHVSRPKPARIVQLRRSEPT